MNMQNQTIIRRIDSVGRLVLPKEVKEMLKMNNLDELELTVTEQGLLIKPVK